MATSIEAIELSVGNLTFTARAAGPVGGRTVVLLHGFPQTSFCWRAQLEALADAGYRAVAPDQRGYSSGARPEGVEQYTVEHLVGDVIAMADELAGHRFDLVGHDWGGAVAWHVAGRYPQRLRTLTVVSTPHPRAFGSALRSGGEQSERSSYMDFFRTPDAPEDLFCGDDGAGLRSVYENAGLAGDVEEYVRVLGRDRSAMTAALNWYRASSGNDLRGLGPIVTPTLYVWSDQDAALGREAAEATGQHVEGPFRFEVLEGVSHWVPEVAADRLNELLLQHLAANP